MTDETTRRCKACGVVKSIYEYGIYNGGHNRSKTCGQCCSDPPLIITHVVVRWSGAVNASVEANDDDAVPETCPECGCCLCSARQCGGDGFCAYCGWEPPPPPPVKLIYSGPAEECGHKSWHCLSFSHCHTCICRGHIHNLDLP